MRTIATFGTESIGLCLLLRSLSGVVPMYLSPFISLFTTAETAIAHKRGCRSPDQHIAEKTAQIENLRYLALVESKHGKPSAALWTVNSKREASS